MMRLTSILFVLSFVLGCEYQGPQLGSVVRDTNSGINTTSPTDIWSTPDVSTNLNDANNSDDTEHILSDTKPISDTSTILGNPPSGIRTCSSDWECQNATADGTYECDDGVCIAPEISCSNDFECTDRNICTGLEQCYQGYCALGTRWNCDDSDPWTEEECNPATGCMYWPVYECIHDDDCGDPDLYCSNQLGGTCVERDTCILDLDCGDTSQCTFDHCVVGQCENIDIECDDSKPNTFDLCDPLMMGCYFPEMCHEDEDCIDLDTTTDSTCVEGECVHTKVYIYLWLLTMEYTGARIDLEFGGVHWPGTLPFEMHLPFQEVCDTGLLIDVLDEDGACLPLTYDSIDVWSGLEQLTPIIVDDGCGGALFVHESLFGCTP